MARAGFAARGAALKDATATDVIDGVVDDRDRDR